MYWSACLSESWKPDICNHQQWQPRQPAWPCCWRSGLCSSFSTGLVSLLARSQKDRWRIPDAYVWGITFRHLLYPPSARWWSKLIMKHVTSCQLEAQAFTKWHVSLPIYMSAQDWAVKLGPLYAVIVGVPVNNLQHARHASCLPRMWVDAGIARPVRWPCC
jgi:hypothetical protein